MFKGCMLRSAAIAWVPFRACMPAPGRRWLRRLVSTCLSTVQSKAGEFCAELHSSSAGSDQAGACITHQFNAPSTWPCYASWSVPHAGRLQGCGDISHRHPHCEFLSGWGGEGVAQEAQRSQFHIPHTTEAADTTYPSLTMLHPTCTTCTCAMLPLLTNTTRDLLLFHAPNASAAHQGRGRACMALAAPARLRQALPFHSLLLNLYFHPHVSACVITACCLSKAPPRPPSSPSCGHCLLYPPFLTCPYPIALGFTQGWVTQSPSVVLTSGSATATSNALPHVLLYCLTCTAWSLYCRWAISLAMLVITILALANMEGGLPV